MTPFHVGMKVVCVDDECGKYDVPGEEYIGGLDGLKNRGIYTVRCIGFDRTRIFCLWLEEIVRPLMPDGHENGYAAARFRPAHENRMEELRSMLVTPPSKAKTKKRVSA